MEIIPPLSSLIPPVTNTPKQRADLLSIKLRLAAILPPADGLVYWHALSDFLNGKITRQELGLVLKKVLSPSSEARQFIPLSSSCTFNTHPVRDSVQLHNALLLSILYNTTRTSLPPISVRHSGWQKRKRDKDGATLEDRDPKRRKLKASVMAIGKRERAELKALVAVGRKGKEERGLLSASLESRGAKFDKDGFPVDVAEAKDPERSSSLSLCVAGLFDLTTYPPPSIDNNNQHFMQSTSDVYKPNCAASRNYFLMLILYKIE